MCGRYTLLADELKVKERFNISGDIQNFSPSYNIAPSQSVLAVIDDGYERRAGYLRWGLIPFWAKDEKIGNNMINARSETVHEKPSFKHLLLRKRCLIVADSFYEWKKTEDGKKPHRIQIKHGELFAFAGLWDKWERNGKKIFTCTMLTKDSDDFMKPIHHRMPIIFNEEQENVWLGNHFNNNNEVVSFISEIESEPLTAYEVSTYVNVAKNNDATCIQPV